MCGIIGYVGKDNALPVLLNGLQRLEYRGYDSAGIVVPGKDKKLQVAKCRGYISELEKLISGKFAGATIGLGHTRWATHGVPSRENAHPHCDCKKEICIVHNGIVENYTELKKELQARGHKFSSQTDSEVIAHLIEEECTTGCPFEDAFRRALKKIKGSYALGVISSLFPGKIMAARLNSPLIVGLGKGENLIASDVPAVIDRTRKIVYLNDSEIVILDADKIEITDRDGNPVDYKVSEIKWDISKVAKGGYQKFMLKEIHEQPQAVRDTLIGRISEDKTKVSFEDSGLDPRILKRMQKLCIVACGTAYHAGIVGRYLLEHFTSIPVEIDIASEFRYRKPKLDEFTFIMTVTQSGETADTLAGFREARRKGCYLLSICNVLGSTIARESDAVVYTHAGPEIGVASTKAYITQLIAFCLFTIYMARIKGQMSDELSRRMIKELETIPDKIQTVLDRKEIIRKCARKYHKASSMLYLGRGFNYPTALEGSLKNKEISYIHTEGYAAGEMKHGPIALIDKKLPVICICTRGDFYEKMVSNMKEVEARAGRIIAVATEGDKEVSKIAEDVIYVPETWEEFSPIINIIPLQLFAYYTALARGCDIDKPRNLAKSVTVE